MASSTLSDRDLRRVVAASLIGATIEWYDFFLYGTVAGIVFNKLYFPAKDPLISILLAYTTFAVGFLARPLGGVIFGHFGDRIGRKSMLVLTLMVMGVATVLIGLLPTYQRIGVAAPILLLVLLVLRVLQGIGFGGEWDGAVSMTYEYASRLGSSMRCATAPKLRYSAICSMPACAIPASRSCVSSPESSRRALLR
jgi:MFS family permease